MNKYLLTFASIAIAGAAHAGQPTVIDGDTFVFNGERVRLAGIDAPELSQICTDKATGDTIPCGKAARAFLVRVLKGAKINCDRIAHRDKYDRPVTRCYANGRDIAQSLVEAGWAVTPLGWPSDYTESEHRAQSNANGLWRMTFEHPQRYRGRAQ